MRITLFLVIGVFALMARPAQSEEKKEKSCKVAKKAKGTIKLTCKDGQTVYFLAAGKDRLLVQVLHGSKPPQVRLVERSSADHKGSMTPVELRSGCSSDSACCDGAQAYQTCLDRGGKDCPIPQRCCDQNALGECGGGPANFDVCRALNGACGDNIFGLI